MTDSSLRYPGGMKQIERAESRVCVYIPSELSTDNLA